MNPHLTQLARQLALTAHLGQTDKNGDPYWLHPCRVASTVQADNQWLAWIHDVVEDTEWSVLEVMHYLQLDLDRTQSLVSITRREDETYGDYLRRVKKNPAALDVKLADLRDNLLEYRLVLLAPPVRDRLRAKYEDALDVLGRVEPVPSGAVSPASKEGE